MDPFVPGLELAFFPLKQAEVRQARRNEWRIGSGPEADI